jgi:hypothetical protein
LPFSWVLAFFFFNNYSINFINHSFISVPSRGHPTPKEGQFTSQRTLSLLGINLTP